MRKVTQGVEQFRSDAFRQKQALFETLAGGQSPEVLFVTCADSRIDPNLLTQTQPGELFVLRTAGNIIPAYGAVFGGEAATVEYAVNALKIEHIVICGHSHCGAMAGLLNPESAAGLPAVLAYLQHAEATRQLVDAKYPEVTEAGDRLKRAVELNVLVQLENLRTHPSVAAAVGTGKLQLHGWVYQFETGEVFAHRDTGDFVPLAESLI